MDWFNRYKTQNMGNKVSREDIPTPDEYLRIRKNVEMSKLKSNSRQIESIKKDMLDRIKTAMYHGENRIVSYQGYGSDYIKVQEIEHMVVTTMEQKGYTCEFQNDVHRYLVWTVKSMEKIDKGEQTDRDDLPPYVYDTNW
jgi:hypothetical protein